MIVFSPSITHRLQYVCDFAGRELTGKPFQLTDRKIEFLDYPGPRLNYSTERVADDEYRIQPHGLLFESGTKEQETGCFERGGYKAFFRTGGDFGFDILAAVFYLLSRYEEYLPHRKDMYGRYAHENSLAFRENFLDTPLVNIWLTDLRAQLSAKFPGFSFTHPRFHFIPTYDIDEAWSYRHKQWWRSAGAALKDFIRLKWKRVAQRRRVLNHLEADPFDSYDWIHDLHRPHKLHPRYFFLVPEKNGKLDRNILPAETALQTLIRQHADKYTIGVHPSWQSGDDPSLIRKEKETIENITKVKVTASRQHFIRFTLPATFRQLIEAGIHEEFSMGYGSINGFRASVATPFYWYDLEREQSTVLLLYPFCYMEANSYFEQKFSPSQALEEMRHYYSVVKNVNGTLITIWHNTFLGTDKLFTGWREVYMQFIKETCGQTETVRPH